MGVGGAVAPSEGACAWLWPPLPGRAAHRPAGSCNPRLPTRRPLPPRSASALEELLSAKQLGANQAAVVDSVKEYYGETLKTSDDLRTSACCTAVSPSPTVRAVLQRVPDEVVSKYYGCGSPFPMGIQGLRRGTRGGRAGAQAGIQATLQRLLGACCAAEQTERSFGPTMTAAGCWTWAAAAGATATSAPLWWASAAAWWAWT